jgi:hypothetical protein
MKRIINSSDYASDKFQAREKNTRFVVGIPKEIAEFADLWDGFDITFFTANSKAELLDYINNGDDYDAEYVVDSENPHFILLTF